MLLDEAFPSEEKFSSSRRRKDPKRVLRKI